MKLLKSVKKLDRIRLYIAVILTIAALVSVLMSYVVETQINEFLLNFGTELLGAGVSFLLIDWFVGNRLEQESKEQEQLREKRELIISIRSDDSQIALQSVSKLREKGWLVDGTLQGAYLANSRLTGAILHSAKLHSANLDSADLSNVVLRSTELQRAFLYNANLEHSDLTAANLEGAVLSDANLRKSKMNRTILKQANLLNANLQGASLEDAVLDENTILPDGTKWHPNADVTRFTSTSI